MTNYNQQNKHAAKPPHLRRDERFTTRCNLTELEEYRALKAKMDDLRKGEK